MIPKQHNSGYKHKANVRTYYQQFEEQQTQSLIDQRIKEHLSGQAPFGIGAPFAAWRPGMRPPILPLPMPIPGGVAPNAQMAPIPRLAVMPRPMGVPGYGGAPMSAPGAGQVGAPGAPLQPNGLPGPPPMTAPTSAPGSQPMFQNPGPTGAPSTTPNSNGPPTAPQPTYQNPAANGNFGGTSMPQLLTFPSSGGNSAYPATSGTDSFAYPQQPNVSH